MTHKEFKTRWADVSPPYGAFDDYLILESLITHYRFLVRPEEFDFLMDKLFVKWQQKKIGYIHVLKEWNECLGAWSVGGTTLIEELWKFIDAIKLVVEADDREQYGEMTNRDIMRLVEFLTNHQEEKIVIYKE
jgi:hypothetical protein